MAGTTATELRTFCHISDFEGYGYRRLHRMIAISRPLTLWSPSSVLLRSKECGVRPRDFLALVESGVVQIAGREAWLLDPDFRDHHVWEGARWDPEIDGAIRDMYYQDQFGDPARRRVVAAPQASGRQWADEFLDAHPEQLDYWTQILTADRAADRIPAGTLKSIQQMPWDPRSTVAYLLGSARNHGEALASAGAEMDFLLRRADAEFMKVMAQARTDGLAAMGPSATPSTPQPEQADVLAGQLLEIMARLDDVRGRGSLLRFVHTGGHQQLVAWFKAMSELVKASDSSDVEVQLLDRLRAEVRKGRHKGLGDLFDGSASTTITAVGAAGAAVEGVQVVQDQSLANVLGVSISAFLIGFGLCQRLGLVGGGFTGIQWPYLYTYGKSPTRSRRTKLLDLLENID